MSERQILIADDHTIVRIGLRYILKSKFEDCEVEEVEDSKSLFEILEKKTYTHLILDLHLKDGNMINFFSTLRSRFPHLPILIYSMSAEETYGKLLLQMGAEGFLNKMSNQAEVVRALHLFFLGRKYFSNTMKQILQKAKIAYGKEPNPFQPQ